MKPLPALISEFLQLLNLERLLAWLQREGFPLNSLEMVTQDEYSHDLTFPLPGSGGATWFVFAMT
jgi:hypothetical protein